MRLKSKNVEPPKGWRFYDKEIKWHHCADSFDNLVMNVISKREFFGKEVDEKEIADEIETSLCSEAPTNFIAYD